MMQTLGCRIARVPLVVPNAPLRHYACHLAAFVRQTGITPQVPLSSRVFSAAPVASESPSASLHQKQQIVPAPQNVVAILRARGLVQDITSPELEDIASQESLLVYCGFDPTAESLHLGNLLGIMVLAWFQRCGHRPVALLGGATGRVGDPSGKSSERPVLSEDVIERNTAGIEGILRSLLAAPPGFAASELLVVNNLDWFGTMPLLTFLRDIGKAARVGTMLAKDSVRSRMASETGISYTEFTYQLLQGYDFVHMARTMGVKVQIGGSDQWGNITAGTDLVRRMLGEGDGAKGDGSLPTSSQSTTTSAQCYGLTFPLLLKSDGTKFGKSESGAIWLRADMLSPYQFYQALLKTADADVINFLRMLTFLPLDEIDEIETAMATAGYLPNTAQRRLAEEVTRFVHGEEGVAQALKATAALAPGVSSGELDIDTLEAAAGDAPSVELANDEIVGQPLADVMVVAGMQPSKAAVRRLIKGGGVRVNNNKVDDEMYTLVEGDLIDGRLMLLAAGKKNKVLLRVTA